MCICLANAASYAAAKVAPGVTFIFWTQTGPKNDQTNVCRSIVVLMCDFIYCSLIFDLFSVSVIFCIILVFLLCMLDEVCPIHTPRNLPCPQHLHFLQNMNYVIEGTNTAMNKKGNIDDGKQILLYSWHYKTH